LDFLVILKIRGVLADSLEVEDSLGCPFLLR
jgi:hypothetical protein